MPHTHKTRLPLATITKSFSTRGKKYRETIAGLAAAGFFLLLLIPGLAADPVPPAKASPSPATSSAPEPSPTPVAVPPVVQEGGKPILGVFIGNDPKVLPQYEDWFGKPADAILAYTGDASWEDYEGSVGWAMGLWKPTERRVLWSVSLIPKNATLAEAAKGTYNSHYKKIAEKLANWHPEEPLIYIRTGWEFNGGWFHYKAVGQPQNFIGAWRQFVTTFRSVSPRFRFDWCPAGAELFPMKAQDAYPGDEYVDIIGLDIYDQVKWCKIKDPVERWKKIYLHGNTGLVWHRDFAAKHGKPMSYPEWGFGGNEAGDNAFFVEQMHQWFIENHVIYATYWNSNSNYKGHISRDEYPLGGAKYKELFGK